MRQAKPNNDLAQKLSWLVAAIMVLVPFHALITVWLASLAGHYTLLRLWKEILLIPILAGSIYILTANSKLRSKLFSLTIVRLIFVYFLLLLFCALIATLRNTVTYKAMLYGLLVDARFLIFFLATLIIAANPNFLNINWQRILLVPAIFVAAIAILQYLVLPYDFLRHFGYSSSTIYPYETINHNLQHLRVMSTLRGANPLGAYLILPLCVLAAAWFKRKDQRLNIALFGGGLVLAMVFSFSRSAWIGALLGVLTVIWLSLKSTKARKTIGLVALAVLIIGALSALALRNNLSFENFVFHTDRASTIALSSNEGHSAAFKSASKDIIHHPLGSGVGTAGPQSVYNNHAKIAENYYLQIGQEAGMLGMILFIAICFSLGTMLYGLRASMFALALFATLIGLSFVNLLSHAWSDDTIAYLFWGLAAVACTPALDRKKPS